jgi:predicted hydrocarbon binding protein
VPCIATGKFLPNRMGLFFLQALEEAIGRDGRRALVQSADPEGRWQTPPPDDLEKNLDFCFFTSICSALEAVYGDRAARKMLFLASRQSFRRLLHGISSLGGFDEPIMRWQSGGERIDHCLAAMGRIFQMLTDMEGFILPAQEGRGFAIACCPECMNRTASETLCSGMSGMIRGMLDWLGAEEEWLVTETACMAGGAAQCTFHIATGA